MFLGPLDKSARSHVRPAKSIEDLRAAIDAEALLKIGDGGLRGKKRARLVEHAAGGDAHGEESRVGQKAGEDRIV